MSLTSRLALVGTYAAFDVDTTTNLSRALTLAVRWVGVKPKLVPYVVCSGLASRAAGDASPRATGLFLLGTRHKCRRGELRMERFSRQRPCPPPAIFFKNNIKMIKNMCRPIREVSVASSRTVRTGDRQETIAVSNGDRTLSQLAICTLFDANR